ncbi:hypothetical protein [Cellulosimicrobium funkei]|nr:hypothetical protein [Cellulosimicrobium funkei]
MATFTVTLPLLTDAAQSFAEDIGVDRFGVVVASWTEGASSLLAEVDASSQEDADAWAAYVSRGDRVHE